MYWIELAFTGLWSLLWKFGLFAGVGTLGVLWFLKGPFWKDIGLHVAIGALVAFFSYSYGVWDGGSRIKKQADVRTQYEVDNAERTRAQADAETSDPDAARGIIDRLLKRPQGTDCNDRRQHC